MILTDLRADNATQLYTATAGYLDYTEFAVYRNNYTVLIVNFCWLSGFSEK